MSRIDRSVPRRRYWVKKERDISRCPKCGGEIKKQFCSYLILIKKFGEIDSHICGTDGGLFCNDCPSVILVREKFERLMFFSKEDIGKSYMVPGIVNLESIPEENRHLEIGSEDNPVPLVEFIKVKKIMQTKAGNSRKNKRKKRR